MTGDVTQDGRGGGAAPYPHAGQNGPPADIGPYRQVSPVGTGSLGAVYRGTDPAGRDVAIKVLRAEIAQDPAALLRLAREVDLMRRVRSPHVADVLNADVTADHPYVVTRFVPGRPLDEVVAAHGPLRPAGLRLLALGLAKALVAIHRVGTVHRDLRPSNVKLVDGEPVVIDFGVAQTVDSTREAWAGTPGETAAAGAAPAAGTLDRGPASPAEDVRAWAVTVVFAATGGTRHGLAAPAPALDSGAGADDGASDDGPSDADADSADDATRADTIGEAGADRADLAEVPEPLRPMLRSALDPDPARRPTADALAQAVAALAVEPDEPASPEPLGRVSRPVVPAGHGAATAAGPEPSRSPAQVAGPGSPAGSAAVERPEATDADLAVAPAWARLFSYLVVATVVSVAIVMPIAGAVLALAGVFVLHAGDAAAERRRPGAGALRLLSAPLSAPGVLVHGVLMTALTIPYAAMFAVTITLALVALVAVGIEPDVLAACAWGMGGSVYVLWAGPGVRAPRRHLTRIFGAVAPEPHRIALVGVVLGTLAVAAVVGAVSLTPSFAPMYALQNSLSSSLDRLQQALD
ncbi:serine/threonine-protein kinase [Actinomadura sp. HBU206391]|uniref:serine/threonine-protein kinase n=1 Tax=Actinomadura sp. HBU206391 TaxID=2731692 RepID=UPI0016503E57|nr:serine/threonine-protein kinase [Actinomadura sp. HBU206391]MBC6459335.1 serine/threonine protein kinase [Actinomadura sp. HBU206391]